MSTLAEIVKALGPGTHLSKLDKFTSSYKTVKTNFNNLLQYPFLQSIVLSDLAENADKDLRTIVTDGSLRFGQLCTTNISVAQQVNSYGGMVPLLLKSLTIAKYASSTKLLIDNYIAQAAASAGDNATFFEELQVYLQTLDSQIELISTKISDLTKKINLALAELAQANVGKVIGNLIKSLFKIASGEEGDIQIATLLTISIDTLTGSFKQVWADQAHLTALIQGLTILKKNLSAIKVLFSALSKALTRVITDSKSLLSTWSDVAECLSKVKNVDNKATDVKLAQITKDWKAAQTATSNYMDMVTGSGSSGSFSSQVSFALVTAAVLNHLAKIPQTEGELKMAALIAKLEDIHPKTHSPQFNFSIKANSNISESDKEKVLKNLGPPKETQNILDKMALQMSGVMKEFNDLLQIPFLNQLQCNDPDKPSDKINIQDIVTNYQKMYYDLQQKTILLAQDLQMYLGTQLTLLPRLVTTDNTQPGEVTVKTYLAANNSIIAKYKTKADAIFKDRFSPFYNWEGTIVNLMAEIKKLTLKAVLMGVGALLCFAAAAFLSGGILVSGALIIGGGALVDMTIDAIEQIGQLKAQIEVARDMQQKLEILLPFMQKIADSLTNITGVWKDITQDLNDIAGWKVILATPDILPIAKPKLITSWTGIQTAMQKYMEIITSQHN